MKKDKKTFYITTPIYYINDVPHIGHAYTTIAADCIARYKRLKGYDVLFLTGTDEYGQKVEKSALSLGLKPAELADQMVVRYKQLWKKLNISNSDFIRTTEKRHGIAVHHLWKKIFANQDIYLGEYQDWYCTPCETFLTETNLIDGKCPDCKRPVEKIKEPSYFFKMSKYQDALLKHIESNPDFIQPESKKKEIVNFIKQGLRDLSLSRTSFTWGIPVPDNPRHIIYVWFDALTNYLTATGYPERKGSWPADIHMVGKDILRFHAVYWPTFLMSAGLPLPKKIFAHGWWTVDGQKMSKSIGNVVDPNVIADKYGVDQFRYFLLREVPFGLDGDFSINALKGRLNADLANDLGNLLSRTIAMIIKYRNGEIPNANGTGMNSDGFNMHALKDYDAHMEALEFNKALDCIWQTTGMMNAYIDKIAPWNLYKIKEEEKLSHVLFNLAEGLRILALYIYPFMPSAADKIWQQLGFKMSIMDIKFYEEVQWGKDTEVRSVCRGDILFPKVDL